MYKPKFKPGDQIRIKQKKGYWKSYRVDKIFQSGPSLKYVIMPEEAKFYITSCKDFDSYESRLITSPAEIALYGISTPIPTHCPDYTARFNFKNLIKTVTYKFLNLI